MRGRWQVEDQIRDAVIKIGGVLPVIGVGIAVCAILTWLAYKAHEDGATDWAWIFGVAAAATLVAVAFSVPTAKTSCRSLFDDDPIAFQQRNCQLLVTCFHGLPGRPASCT
jgi:hypothetical protein